jgi:mannose-6-phosphate isomerase
VIRPARRVEKPWGHEEIWAETARYVGKVLAIRKGHRLSLQHHEVKDETLRVSTGQLQVELEDAQGVMQVLVLGPGDIVRIAPGRRHRMLALEDVDVFEVSTPELDDIVRHEDDYGRS